MNLRSLILCLLVTTACDNEPTPVACTDVPDGGCPEDNGADVCQDPTCAAVYECTNSGWVFQQACPPHPHDASADVLDAGTEGGTDGSVPDVHIDAPPGAYGGPGCVELEAPDCPLGTAIACGGTLDCCGCEDLYVCDDGGWDPWGVCADGGIVQN